MHRHLLAKIPCFFVLFLAPTLAHADRVLLLPAKGQVPGHVLSQTLENETRLGVLELSHSLVAPSQSKAALQRVADGAADSPEELSALSQQTQAHWVLTPAISESDNSYRLEISAYYASLGRTESVSREIDPDRVHQQVVEMMRVILRPEGVGTGELPWEKHAPALKPTATADSARTSAPPAPSSPPATSSSAGLFLGVGLGFDASLKRPQGAVGNASSALGALQLGWQSSESFQLAIGGKSHLSGPRAFMVDASARYLFPVGSERRFMVGPELGLGVFVSQGGSKDTTPMARLSGVAAWKASQRLALLATLGDLAVIPASSGTLVLGGASLNALVRF